MAALGRSYWNAHQILSACLPAAVGDIPSSFEVGAVYVSLSRCRLVPTPALTPRCVQTVGHLAHMNLQPEHEPFKQLIGEVILDKTARLRTVVSKCGAIHAQFRYFDMEVLAGEPDFVVEVKENGCTFRLDYAKVYWNSRLETEHKRIVASLDPVR